MKKFDIVTLFVLSAIWGASFLFMRIGADDFGPFSLVFIRMFSAFLFISPLLFSGNRFQNIVKNFPSLALLGLMNQVLPFLLFSFATLKLEAGFTSLINSTTPIFTAIVGVFFFALPLQRHQVIGLTIAFIGICVLSSNKLDFSINGEGWAILAAIAACLFYAWSANFIRRLNTLDATEISLGSTLASSLILVIPGWLFWPENNPDAPTWASAIALGAICTGLAFLLFYRLVNSAGAVTSTTVTILVPIFAIVWGVLLLDETVTLRMIAGMTLALGGTAIAIKLVYMPLQRCREQKNTAP